MSRFIDREEQDEINNELAVLESVAQFYADEDGIDMDEEMEITKSLLRLEREINKEIELQVKRGRALKGYCPITEDSFRGY